MNKKTLVWIFVLFSLSSLGFATNYDYWIEHDENNNPQNYVWVKVDSIPASSTKTIYAIKESGFSPNGDNVFELFDDFEGSSLNTSKWSSNTGTVSDSKLQIVNTITTTIPINQYVITWYGKRSTTGNEVWFGIGNWDERTPDGSYASWRDYHYTKLKYSIEHTAWEESTYVYSSDSTDSWYYFDLILADSNINWKLFTKTGSSLIDYSTTKSASLTDVNTLYFVKDPDRDVTDMQFDYVFVRKYTATEPTITVTDMGTYYKIDITNNEASELTDYQVAIPINDLDVSSTDESIKFTDTLPTGETVTIFINQTSGYVGDYINVSCSANNLDTLSEYRFKKIIEGIGTSYTDSFTGVTDNQTSFFFTILQSQAHTNITVTCELEKNESGTWNSISSDAEEVEVLNTPPTEPDISLNYIDIVGGNIVQATCENSTDTVDGDSITYRLIVTNSTDTLHNSITNFTYITSKSQINQTLTFTCVADDGYDTNETSQNEFVYGVDFSFDNEKSLGSYTTSYQTSAQVIPNQIKVNYTYDGTEYVYCDSNCNSSGSVTITDLGNHDFEWKIFVETENYTASDNFWVFAALINLTIKDEKDLSLIDIANVSFVTDDYGYRFNYSSSNSELGFVTYGDGFLLIQKNGYFSETIPMVTTNQTGDIIAYILKTTDGTTMQVQLKDSLSQPLAGKFVDLYKYYSSENAYIRVTTKITDSQGYALVPLETDSFYKYYARISINDTPHLAYPYPFQPTANSMTLYYGSFSLPVITFGTLANLEYNLSTSRTGSNETVVSFFFNDKTGFVTQGCVEAYDRRITTDVFLDSNCVNASSGTVFVTIPDANWSRTLYYKAKIYIKATNQWHVVKTGYVKKETDKVFGSTSLFVIMLISISAVAIGSVMSPIVGFIMLAIVMFTTSLFGVTIMASSTIISFIVVVLFILFKK